MGRQHQDRPGVQLVPEGSGKQGKMEKTACKIVCGAPMTLGVKGLMMMMMMMMMMTPSSHFLTASVSRPVQRQPVFQDRYRDSQSFRPVLLLAVPAGSPSCGRDVTVYVCEINQPSLPTHRYSVLVAISVFMALSTLFHSLNSPDNSPFSHSVLPVLSPPHRSSQLYASS